MKDKILWNKCDICGKLISFSDFQDKKASRILTAPDSDYSSEEYETLCAKHNKKSK
jgi:hypothetical protein